MTTLPEINKLMNEWVRPDGPGAAVLLVEKDEILHAAGYGLADLASKRPITPASSFDLASCSKQFTGTAIALLAARGQLSIDDEVAALLPTFSVPTIGRPVRVSDLLWHVSGLVDYTTSEWKSGEFECLSTGACCEWLNGTCSPSAPGVKQDYNNSNYVLLARIVEQVACQSFEAFLTAEVFYPLGMKNTHMLSDRHRAIPNRVTGYTRGSKTKEPKLVSSPTVILGDGNIFTTIEDLARWDAGLRKGKLLDKAWLDRAWKSGRLDDGSRNEDDVDNDGYGFGWRVHEPGEDTCVWHVGSWDGTSTYVHRWFESDRFLAILSNDDTFDGCALAVAIDELRDG